MNDNAYCLTIPEHAVGLLRDMHSLQRDGSLCDVKLMTSNGHVMVHRIVLLAASPFFRERVAFEQKVDNPVVLFLDDTDQTCLNCMVNFLYTGEMHIPCDTMQNFIRLCNQLKLTELAERCRQLYEDSWDIQNVKCEYNEDILNVESQNVPDTNCEFTSIKLNKKSRKSPGDNNVAISRRKRKTTKSDIEVYEIHEVAIKLPKLSIKLPAQNKKNKKCRSKSKKISRNKKLKECDRIQSTSDKDLDKESHNSNQGTDVDLKLDYDYEDDNEGLSSEHCDIYVDIDEDYDIEDTIYKPDKNKGTKIILPKAKQKPKVGLKSSYPKDCKICNETLKTYKEFLGHMKSHKLAGQKKKRKKKYFMCSACGKTLTAGIRLACHQYTKHGIPYDPKYKLHTCTFEGCNYITASKNYLQTHMRGRHSTERPHVCEYCGKGFKLPSALWTHRNIHTNAKLYECKECNLTFNQKAGLDIHDKKHHQGEAAWTELCHLCSEKFLHKSELCWHLYQAHQIPVPDRYTVHSCTLCDFQSIQKVKVERHMDAHNDKRSFVCAICGKKFVTKSYLNRHMMYHGEKKYKCEFEGCTYACVDKLTLSKHTRLIHTHKNFKPFLCTICAYKTGLRGNLDKHIRTVHNLEVVTKHTLNLKMKFKGHNSGDIITKDGQFVQKVVDIRKPLFNQVIMDTKPGQVMMDTKAEQERMRTKNKALVTQPPNPDNQDKKTADQSIPEEDQSEPPKDDNKLNVEDSTPSSEQTEQLQNLAPNYMLTPAVAFGTDEPVPVPTTAHGAVGVPVPSQSNAQNASTEVFVDIDPLQFKYPDYY